MTPFKETRIYYALLSKVRIQAVTLYTYKSIAIMVRIYQGWNCGCNSPTAPLSSGNVKITHC